jgi:hypothetical protein
LNPFGNDEEGGEIHGLEAETTKCAQIHAWYYILFYPAGTHRSAELRPVLRVP